MKKLFLFLSFFTFSSLSLASDHYCRSLEVIDVEKEKHTLSLCAESHFDVNNYVDVISNVTLNGMPIQIGNRNRDLLSKICGVMHNRTDDIAFSRTERSFPQAIKLEMGEEELIYELEEAKKNKNLKTIKSVECQSLEFYMHLGNF